MSTYRLLGYDKNVHTCDCCGKAGLSGTVRMATLNERKQNIGTVYFGTTCASRQLGVGTDKHIVASIKREAQFLESL